MSKFTVIFHPEAEGDIRSSYEWGCRVWGKPEAKIWAQHLRRRIKTRLTELPASCPLAPESEDIGTPVRQLVIERYRVLFIIEKKTVTILHLRGAWLSEIPLSELDQE